MVDVADAGAAGSEQAPIISEHKAGGEGTLSTREAANSLIDWRRKNAAATPDESAPAATPDESAVEAEASEAETPPPGETTEADAAEMPPIEPPRSWTKEDKELFKALPRETQERLNERERSRDSDFSRRQQEVTEKAKAFEAERQKVEQARQQYESALPILLSNLTQAMGSEFSDINTMADVQKMAAEDPFRYAKWDAQQKQIAGTQQEIVAAQQRQQDDFQNKWSEFTSAQDRLFSEKVPDMADNEKAAKLKTAAVNVLRDAGFTDDELHKANVGQLGLSLRDHRTQLLIYDAIRYREMQQTARTIQAKAKPVPPVQRPGVAQSKGAQRDAEPQALGKQLDNSHGISALRAAAQIVRARRSGR